MKKIRKIYLLYSDIKKTKLLACAESVKERKDYIAYYSKGQWFSYDCSSDGLKLYSDTEKTIKCSFPKKPKKISIKI